HRRLGRLRDQLRGDAQLRGRIEHQFSMKNTMGYALNAFLDFDEPVQILAHLLVGSEGTLAYIASVVLRTVPVPTHNATTLLTLPDISAATDALPRLLEAGANAGELREPSALWMAQQLPAAPEAGRRMDNAKHTGLLV